MLENLYYFLFSLYNCIILYYTISILNLESRSDGQTQRGQTLYHRGTANSSLGVGQKAQG